MAGINISSLTSKNSAPATGRRRSTPSLSELSDAYRNPSRHEDSVSLDCESVQTEAKVGQKQIKSGLKVDQEVGQKQIKSRSKAGQKNTPLHHRQAESGLKVGLKVGHEVGQKQIKSGLKVGQKQEFSHVSGLQRKLLYYVFNDCINNGSKESPFYNINKLSSSLSTSNHSVKSAIRQLRMKGIIEKNDFKDGRGGGTKFLIPDQVFRELLNESRLKVDQKWVNSRSKVGSEVGSEVGQNVPSSSLSINTKTNTITTSHETYDWVHDIQTPENLKSLGLGLNHIKQLKEKFSLSTEQIQDGLEAFSFDLAKGELERLKARGVQNIIGYFFGAMKTGGYNSVCEGFVSSEQMAEKEMIERLAVRNKERQERKEKLEDLLFEEWLETKSKDEILEIEKPTYGHLDMFHKAGLKDYFQKNEIEKFKAEFQ